MKYTSSSSNFVHKIATFSYKSLFIAGFVILSSVQSAKAEIGVPVLDYMKAHAPSYLEGEHEQYTLTTTQGENTHYLLIAGTKYYYTPSESSPEKNNYLTYLAGTALTTAGASAENYVFTDGTNYYTFDTSNLPSSAYTLTTEGADSENYDISTTDGDTTTYYKFDINNENVIAGTEEDHDFSVDLPNGTKYYKVSMNTIEQPDLEGKVTWSDELNTAPEGFTWKNNYDVRGSDVIVDTEAKTISGAVRSKSSGDTWDRWYTYTYTAPEDYDITQDRINNTIASDGSNVQNKVFAGITNNYYGSAIYNTQNLSDADIQADFIGNNSVNNGGAIYNVGTNSSIHSITGNFIANTTGQYGGAIYNSGTNATINSITGDFIANSAAYGTIYNTGIINSIIGSFINNAGSGIYNYGGNSSDGTIGSITGNFIGNTETYNGGGAIRNEMYASINSIVGDFISNRTEVGGSYGGGAIKNYSDSTIDFVVGDFISNTAKGDGGAIYNGSQSAIGSIEGDFIGNTAEGRNGGAIYNYNSTIGSITGDFIGNRVQGYYAYGGAVHNGNSAIINTIIGDFINNSAISSSSDAMGGAIYDSGSAIIGSIKGNFINNRATGYKAEGGAIHIHDGTSNIGSIFGDFIDNSATSSSSNAQGGAIYNNKNINSINGNFIGNSATLNSEWSSSYAFGGAIYNYSDGTISAITGDFIGNSAFSTSNYGLAEGGAIYNRGKISLAGNTFTGNYVQNGEEKKLNSIYNEGKIIVADGAFVTIDDGYDGSNSGQLTIGNGSIFNLSVDNGTLQTDNLGIVVNSGSINWDMDADLLATDSDRITVTSLDGTQSVLIRSINLLTDKAGVTDILLTENEDLMSAYTLASAINDSVFSPNEWFYTVSYNPTNGILTFNGIDPVTLLGDATIDTVNKQSRAYLALGAGNHAVYTDLVTTKDEDHPDMVIIDGGTYYFKAAEADDAKTAQIRNLAVTGANTTKEVTAEDDYIFSVNGKYYTYATKKLPVSAWLKGEGTADSYDYYDYAEDNTTKQYHTFAFKDSAITKNGLVTFTAGTEEDHDFSVDLPNGTKYYKINVDLTKDQNIGYNITTYSDKSDSKSVTNPANNTVIIGGAALNNPENSTIYLEKVVFANNKFTGNISSTNTTTRHVKIAGGAVYNAGTISNLTADFINNTVESTLTGTLTSTYDYALGGAIYNTGTIGGIIGDFINNSANNINAKYYSRAQGGAIYNNGGTISSISGDFINNNVTSNNNSIIYAQGGAIYNDGTITSVNGDFINNRAVGGEANQGYVQGGAIYNLGTIDSIIGDFISNETVYTQYGTTSGGAIYNSGTINSIIGDFISNVSKSGGAIYNSGNINTITGYFIDNIGSAIKNIGKIKTIVGDFISNSDVSLSGVAINNSGANASIDSIVGNFINNSAFKGSSISGGAIYNYLGTINSITGDFISNNITANSNSKYTVKGGALYTSGTIDFIIGDFISNSASGAKNQSNYLTATGGAISNSGTGIIGTIEGDFINNTASGSATDGGAIYNEGTISAIDSDFAGNSASGSSSASGGAIYNKGTIGSIDSNFEGNSVTGSSSAYGGAIYTAGNIGSITGNFINNSATSTSYTTYGGAINLSRISSSYGASSGTIDSIEGNFVGNHAISTSSSAYGGAIHNGGTEITTIIGDFSENSVSGKDTALGGAIHNWVQITTLKSNFTGNSATTTAENNTVAQGGAIYNKNSIDTVDGDFINNSASSSSSANGGAIYNAGKATAPNGTVTYANITSVTGKFKGNFTKTTGIDGKALGGAIYSADGASINSLVGDFEGNSAISSGDNGTAKGGAVYNDTLANITSIKGDFINNNASGTKTAQGGAVYNTGSATDTAGSRIDSIEGDFIGNSVTSSSGTAAGGALYNEGQNVNIGNIDGDFINNNATGNIAQGGAVSNNSAKIGNIDDKVNVAITKYIAKKAETDESVEYWSNYDKTRIDNYLAEGKKLVITNIYTANLNNQTEDQWTTIQNNIANGTYITTSPLADLTEDDYWKPESILALELSSKFTDNTAIGVAQAQGGALYNGRYIDNESEKTIVNLTKYVATRASTGEKWEYWFAESIPNLEGLVAQGKKLFFVTTVVDQGDKSESEWASMIQYTQNDYHFTTTDPTADLTEEAYWQPHYSPSVMAVTGDFTGNTATATAEDGIAQGGAIYNEGTITIDGNFEGNSATATAENGIAQGGAIYNEGTVTIDGEFEGNTSTASNGTAQGGFVYNAGTIDSIEGDFTDNTATGLDSYGGAIANKGKDATITSIKGNFTGNKAAVKEDERSWEAQGGAIYNSGRYANIGTIEGNFTENAAIGYNAKGGAIYNTATKGINSIVGDFTNNSAKGMEEDSETYGGAIYSEKAIGTIEGNFVGNSASGSDKAYGGAIYNTNSITSLEGNFEGNSATATNERGIAQGGAIYNAGRNANIGTIEGNFTENAANNGGAIYNNSSATIGTIKGDFIRNTGGAIRNDGKITSIEGNFNNNTEGGIGNTGTITSIKGIFQENSYGAVFNVGTIDSIEGDFINNTNNNGGAIFNQFSIGDINIGSIEGNFIGNSAQANGGAITNSMSNIGTINANFNNNTSNKGGGAIFNTYASISSITGNFEGNTVTAANDSDIVQGGAIYNYDEGYIGSISGDFINNAAVGTTKAQGGAINNKDATIDSVIGDFSGNSVTASGTNSTAQGGAIYNEGTITLSGNTFRDNYVQVGEGENAVVTPNSIYNAGTINLAEGTTVTVNDGWQSSNDGNLVMGTGSTLNMNIANGTIQEDSLGNLTKNGTINATVDIDFSKNSGDTISTSGVVLTDNIKYVTLDSINILDNISNANKDTLIQILKTQEDGLELTLSDDVQLQFESMDEIYMGSVDGTGVTTYDEVASQTDWSKKYQKHITADSIAYGKLGLTKTDTENDSIGVVETRRAEGETADIDLEDDTLKLVNKAELAERTFDATEDGETYTVSEDLGVTAEGKLSINGVAGGEVETIDLAGKEGFELANTSTLELNDVKLTGKDTLASVTSADVTVNLHNAVVDGDIVSTETYAMNLSGDNALSGTVDNAQVTMDSGSLRINEETLKNASLDTDGGVVELSDEGIKNYQIGNLTSTEETSYNIDLDVSDVANPLADTITANGSGTVKLGQFKMNGDMGNIPTDMINKSFIVQILKDSSADLELELSDYAKSQLGDTEYEVSVMTHNRDDIVQANNTWDTEYNYKTQDEVFLGTMGLATTTNENDSIGITLNGNSYLKDIVVGDSMGDTLKLVNGFDTEEDKTFNAPSENSSYTVSENIGETKGTVSIDGKDGTIDFGNHKAFEEIGVGAAVYLKDVTLKGATGDIADVKGGTLVAENTVIDGTITNSGVVDLTESTIGDVVNNNIMEVNSGVTLGEVSGHGTTNINADMELTKAINGNTVNVNGSTLTGADKLGSEVVLNANGATIDIRDDSVKVKKATFDKDSTLAIKIGSLDKYGSVNAENITIEEGAKLQATLGQGLATVGKTSTVKLLSAENKDFNNFADSYDNNMYHFEKADKNGTYNISLVKTAEDVAKEESKQDWVSDAAAAWVDEGIFNEGTVPADIADKVADLAQNDSKGLVNEIKKLAPTEANVIYAETTENTNRLFKIVDAYLRGEQSPMGFSSGDDLDDVSIWGKVYIGESKISRRGTVAGSNANSKGAILGVEKKFDTALKVGAGVQFDSTDIKAFSRKIKVDSTTGFIYSEYKPDKWFINSVASHGYASYDERKYALGNRYDSEYNVHLSSIAAMFGYEYGIFTPEAGLRYYHIKQDGYTDALGQSVKEDKIDILRAVAGVRMTKDFGRFRPEAYIGLTYDISNDRGNTTVNLSNGSSYTVPGKRLNKLGYETSIGLEAKLGDSLSASVSYIGAYRDNYQEHTGMFNLKYNF